MFLDYSKIEKIKFHSEDIDHDFNIRIFNTFEKLYHKAKEKNLDFIITGGLGSCLLYKKIYRTITDIDILIIPGDIRRWFEVFIQGYDFCFEDSYTDNPSQRLRDFFNNQIKSLVFMDDEYKCKIEIINMTISKDISHSIVIENNYPIKIKNQYFSYTNKLTFGREKDFVDWEFFQTYLNNLDLNLNL